MKKEEPIEKQDEKKVDEKITHPIRPKLEVKIDAPFKKTQILPQVKNANNQKPVVPA